MRHLNQSGFWPSGNPRLYYRPKGRKGIPLPDAPTDSAAFRKAYSAAEAGETPADGTLAHAIARFQKSPEFGQRAPSTRQMWMRSLDDFRKLYGSLPFDGIRTKHIKSDLAKFDPHPANNRMKAWKALFRWLEDIGAIEIDPARPIRKRRTEDTGGFTAWTREDFDTFRAHWGVETRERLAFEVYYRSCAATVDAVVLGPGMVSDGWLTYCRSKTGAPAVIPWSAETAPDWFEWSDDLEACLAHHPRHMTFLATAQGRTRSQKSASQWFSAACRAAGLDLSAHGIRKGRATVFRENGATEDQRMAVLGHETQEEANAYSKSADLRRVIESSNSSSNFGATVFRIAKK